MNMDLEVRTRFALDVQSTPAFIELVALVAAYEQQCKTVVVKDEAGEGLANGSLIAVRDLRKKLKAMEAAVVAFPKAYIAIVKGGFAPLGVKLDKADERIAEALGKWRAVLKSEEEKKHREALEEFEKKQQEVPEVVGVGEENVAVIETEAPKAPGKPKVAGTTEGKLHYTTVTTVKVTDLKALVKAVVSTSKKLVDVGFGLLTVDLVALKKLAVGRKASIPGVKVETGEVPVTSKKS